MSVEQYSRGWRGAPAKGVEWVTAARVQIPPAPPYEINDLGRFFVLFFFELWYDYIKI